MIVTVSTYPTRIYSYFCVIVFLEFQFIVDIIFIFQILLLIIEQYERLEHFKVSEFDRLSFLRYLFQKVSYIFTYHHFDV